jgi:Tfp pilus assembly PilM family ATPase
MFSFSKKRPFPIGVDMSDDALKLIQLGTNGDSLSLVCGGSKNLPGNMEYGSSEWQRWAIQAIREMTGNGKFNSRQIVAAVPASEVFIEHMKIPKDKDGAANIRKHIWGGSDKIYDAVFSKIKGKLPFDPNDAIVRHIATEEDNLLVTATERTRIDRHLAIYEKVNLEVKSIAIWPEALITTYVRFFARREADLEAVVMLLDMEAECTNIVICRHKHLLFARSVPIGARSLGATSSEDAEATGPGPDEMMARLVLELSGCKRHFCSMHRRAQIERLIFLSTAHRAGMDREVCTKIAKQLDMPAQMGDCLAAVEIADPYDCGIDRRDSQVNWATAFGLSLS